MPAPPPRRARARHVRWESFFPPSLPRRPIGSRFAATWRRVCFQQQINAMLPAPGTYHFPWEINSASIPEGKTLRTFGKLCFYNTVMSEAILTAQHASVQHQIRVCTKFVEPFQAHLGSLYIVLGETDYRESEEVVIKARVFSCVEGINLQLLQKAIEEQRKYLHERKNHLEAKPS